MGAKRRWYEPGAAGRPEPIRTARGKVAGADAEAAESATSIRRYFNEAAPRHHEDEEIDLFPRLPQRLALFLCQQARE